MNIYLIECLGLSAILFSLGIYGVLTRRNGVMLLMALELILSAVTLNLAAFGAFHHTELGQMFGLFVIAISAAEVGLGLAILLLIYRNQRIGDVDDADEMRG